jgi:type VI secretion system secreted protein Hcp
MGIYWKIGDGPDVKGDSTEASHENWIRVNGLSFGSGRFVGTHTGRLNDREADNGAVSEITLSKDLDNASVELFFATAGDEGKKMTIEVTKTEKGAEVTYLKYELENALVTSYGLGAGSDGGSEQVTVNFTKISKTYTSQGLKTTDKNKGTVSFNQTDHTGEGL